eukprot:bmy_15725T0
MVITDESGMLCPCVMLEGEEEGDQLALTGRFWIIPDILEPTVICITGAHECPIKAPKAFIKHSPSSISSALCLRRCQGGRNSHIPAETQHSFKKHIMSTLPCVVTNPAF